MVNMLRFLPQETTYEMDIWHLKAELARIDILIRREVRRWQMAGQNPDDAFRGLVVSDVDAEQLAQMPLGGNWGQLVDLPEEEETAFEAELEQAGVQIQDPVPRQYRVILIDRERRR